MSQLVEALATKIDDLSLIPDIHMMARTNSYKLSSDLHTLAHMHTRVYTHTHTHTQVIIYIHIFPPSHIQRPRLEDQNLILNINSAQGTVFDLLGKW